MINLEKKKYRGLGKCCVFLLVFALLCGESFSQTLLWTEDFGSANPTGWVISSTSGNDWVMNEYSTTQAYNNDYYLSYYYHSTEAANSYTYTKGVNMTAGADYHLMFYTSTRGFTEKLRVKVGSAQTPAAQTTQLYDNSDVPSSWTEITTNTYTAPSTGTYYFSFQCYSAADQFELKVDNVRVYETINTNNESDIIEASFNELDNIDYASFTTASGLTTTNAIKVGSFTIRDGGATSPDSDSDPTTLTDIIFTVANHENITALAIFDGTSNVSEQTTVGASVSFSGLTLAATDGNTKTFDLYCTFETTVDDNEQIQFTISSATANASGSTFAAADAGGASTDITGDDNRIEVIAQKITITTDASDACKDNAMSNFVVECRDNNNNIDLDYVTDVSLSSTGTLSGGGTATPGSGIATFSSITHSATGTNLQLTTSSDLTDVSSAFFDVSNPATMTTTTASSITGSTASCGGNITSDGGSAVTARGVCWNTTGLPTTSDSKTTDGSGTGVFVSSLTSLSANTTYYVRAYATTGCGDSYGNEVSFTTLSNLSDITYNDFDETNNIDYTSYLTASGLTTGNAIKVGSFTIRDGGGSADNDGESTTLTDITFSVTNHENVTALAIFDGASNLSEQTTVGASTSFSGLTLAATDGNSKTFDLYCTFETTVDDNEQIQFTVSSATANSSGSSFGAADAGGATNNYAEADDNKLEVTASALAYGADASNTCLSSAMTTVTVKAVDGNGNTDADFTTDIKVTSTGTLTGSPVTATPSSGVTSFATLTHTATGTGLTLNAERNDDGTWDVTSSTFDITICNNNTCATAFEVLTDGTPTTSIDVTNYTDIVNPSCGAAGGTEDAWYYFTAPTSGMVIIDVDDSGLSGTDANKVEGALFDACGGTEIQCFANTSTHFGSSTTASGHGRLVTGLTGGATYYLMLEHYNNDWTGTYDVIIKDAAPPMSMGVQYCEDMSVNSQDVADLVCATCSASDPNWLTTGDKDKVWTFTPASNGTVNINVSSLSGFTDENGFVFTTSLSDATCGLASSCNDAGANNNLTATGVAVTGGTTYYLIVSVDGYSSTPTGSFCVQIDVPCGSTATTSAPTVDCSGGTYTGRINFSTLTGATTYNLEDDDGNSFTGISASTDYDFNYTDVLKHTVTLKGYDGSSNLVCIDEFILSSGCNGSDAWSASAPDLSNGNCYPGDLSTATADGPTDGGISGASGGVAGFSTNNLRSCGGGFDNATNWIDVWYQVDLPDGTDEMTIIISGLQTGEYLTYVLNTGDPGASNANNLASTTTASEVNMFFSNTVTSHTIEGLAGESTAPIYIRILTADPDNACGSITTPDFTICVIYPQPNDVCANAINITTNNGGAQEINNLNLYAQDNGNEYNCSGTDGQLQDAWYEIFYPSDPGTIEFLTNVYVQGTNGKQIRAILYDVTAACGLDFTDADACEEISLDGTTQTTTFSDIKSTDGFDRFLQIMPLTGNVGNITVSAEVVLENNTCEVFEGVEVAYDIGAASKNANFVYSSASGVVLPGGGSDAGTKDLFFNFSSTLGTLHAAHSTYSGKVDITLGSISSGTYTLAVYKRDPLYSSPCTGLVGNLVSYQTGINSDGTNTFCLDIEEGDYICRLIKTAGADETITISATPSATSPLNCEGVYLENNAQSNLTLGDFDIISNSFTGEDFTKDNDGCETSLTDQGNGGTGKDLWYTFETPADPTCDPTVSEVREGITFTYTASSGNDGINIDLYSTVSDGGYISSKSISAASGTATFTGLNASTRYYARVEQKDFGDVNVFDISAAWTDPIPCYDKSSDAWTLSVLTELDIPNLPIYSADGATVSEGTNDDVWFEFTAPAVNGDNYPTTTANLSFVTVYLESISGDGFEVEVWDTISGVDGAADRFTVLDYQTNSVAFANDYEFIQIGHLVPGQRYWIQVSVTGGVDARKGEGDNNPYAKAGANERFKLAVLNPGYSNSGLCSSGSVSVFPTKLKGCEGDCQAIYKFEVDVTGDYQIEATGDQVNVDLKVWQADTEGGGEQNEGYPHDYDHPCQVDRLLKGAVSTAVLGDEHGCGVGSAGERNVYNLVASSSTNRIYYFIEVTDQTAGGSYHGCGGSPALCKLQVYAEGSNSTLFSGGCKFLVLPIELIGFSGEANDEGNQLYWETASEINSSHTIVQFSEDGLNYTSISRVEAAGNSNQKLRYNYLHTTNSELSYYRLKFVDFDGTWEYSNVISVRREKLKEFNNQVSVYPNPTSGKLLLEINDEYKSGIDVKIFDSVGKEVASYLYVNSKEEISLSGLENGVYFMQVAGSEFSNQVIKIIKQ